MATSPVKGKYDVEIDSESAYEVLLQRVQETAPPPPGSEQTGGAGGWISDIGATIGNLFGTTRPRGQRLTVGQHVTRDVTRSVVNRVAGKVAGDLGKQVAGSMGNTIGRAIVRGTLGGLLRR
jgi:hypothetical protein